MRVFTEKFRTKCGWATQLKLSERPKARTPVGPILERPRFFGLEIFRQTSQFLKFRNGNILNRLRTGKGGLVVGRAKQVLELARPVHLEGQGAGSRTGSGLPISRALCTATKIGWFKGTMSRVQTKKGQFSKWQRCKCHRLLLLKLDTSNEACVTTPHPLQPGTTPPPGAMPHSLQE